MQPGVVRVPIGRPLGRMRPRRDGDGVMRQQPDAGEDDERAIDARRRGRQAGRVDEARALGDADRRERRDQDAGSHRRPPRHVVSPDRHVVTVIAQRQGRCQKKHRHNESLRGRHDK